MAKLVLQQVLCQVLTEYFVDWKVLLLYYSYNTSLYQFPEPENN